MAKPGPDQLLLAWLNELPQRYRDTLVCRYIFMTCTDSSDLVLSGDEAWRYLRKQLLVPDFPLRRVARLLTARTVLSFLLDCLSDEARESSLAEGPALTLTSLDTAQYQRANQHFQEFCAAELSDAALQEWLRALQGWQ